MNNEKNKFLTVSWLSGLLSAEIFISTGEWGGGGGGGGVQMPPLTSENSHFLWSGPQGATLVMWSVPSDWITAIWMFCQILIVIKKIVDKMAPNVSCLTVWAEMQWWRATIARLSLQPYWSQEEPWGGLAICGGHLNCLQLHYRLAIW